MDLIFYSYKSRLRQGWRVILVMSLLFYVAHSWRISQKCPHGHYYNDGCTACWCDTRTGVTKCERLLQCTRREVVNQVKCPRGRIYKDSCGNDCSCYESTGTVFCNEKRKCPQEIVSVSTAVPLQTTTVPPITFPNLNGNNFIRRDGLAAAYAPNEERQASLPPLPVVSSSTYPPIRTANPVRRSTIFDQFAVSSTPRPQVRIPARSEELIIEPAIIIRTKGSNKASVVRNPSSATSVLLSSSRRGNGNKPATIILNKSDHHVSSYPTQQFSASSSVNPLTLYEKQLKTIMDIKRAYSQLLHSKVNFNFQIATGKNPVTQNTVTANNNNMHFNSNQGLSPSYGNSMSMDHPRRFDTYYDNSTILVNTTPSPSVVVTNHDYKSPLKPFFWRREQIKNALKQFSPVPPLRQLVSYVSTSTESYLSQFLNNLNKNKQQQNQQQPETTTSSPRTIPPALPTPYYPMSPYSTPESLLDHHLYDDQFPSISPIHEVYQNHNFRLLSSTTPSPSINYKPYDTFPQHYSYNHPSHFDKSTANHQEHTTQFPFMNELMQEIVRSDHHSNIPTATPRSSPALTAVPTFQTPGPPYAEIDVVQPLSFLPPPEPEPATPTKRTFMMSTAASKLPTLPILLPRQNHPRPTVRINLDKPIYVPNSPQFQLPPNPQQMRPQAFSPQQQPFLPQQQPFSPQQQPFSPQQQQPAYPQQHHPIIPQRQPPFLPQQQPFPPQHQPFLPQQQTYLPQQNRRNHNVQQPFLNTRHFIPHLPRPTVRHPYQHHNHHPIQRYPSHQFFIPTRPKQYRLVLKGRLKEAATRVDDGVPLFVSKIAHEFFKKPDIYVPKIRPGKPLTLEKVVLNHKEIVPKEVMLSQAPGVPPTKLRFSPQAHWKMREDLNRQGVLLNEPHDTALRDYARGDPNVMEMDAPIKAINTWETHTGMTMGTYSPELGYGLSSANHGALQESQRYQPVLLPSPTPPPHTTASPPPSLDFQHQQELQHQLLLAQQQQQQEQHLQHVPVSSGSINNENSFNIDPGDFNDFNQHTTSETSDDALPYQLNIPGVKQVVVDKYVIHDPLDPSGGIQMFSTTTVEPPLEEAQNVDLSSILSNQPQPQYIQRQGLPVFTPTPPPAVLIRHHGAPSPSPPPELPTAAPNGNYFLTVINSTPKPLLSSTSSPTGNSFHISNTPTVVMTDSASGTTSVVSQIHEFLNDQMDFGARPQLNLYDMLFHSRTGISGHPNLSNHRTDGNSREEEQQNDQMATATNFREEEEEKDDVDTEKLATIFSTDYKHKYNRKPPEVIVIKVPHGHSDGPFPKVVERHRGQEIEIIGGQLHSSQNHSMSDSKEGFAPSKETSLLNPSEDDSEEALGAEIMSSAKKRRRNRKGNKRKRKRKKKKGRRNKNKSNRPTEEDADEEPLPKPDDLKHNGYGYGTDNSNDKTKNEEESREAADSITTPIGEAEQKFQSEIDWKSQLMANICELNPSSPLCLTYRSICLLMTSDD